MLRFLVLVFSAATVLLCLTGNVRSNEKSSSVDCSPSKSGLNVTPEAVQWFRDTGIALPSALQQPTALHPIAEPQSPFTLTALYDPFNDSEPAGSAPICRTQGCLDRLACDVLTACRSGVMNIMDQVTGRDRNVNGTPTQAPAAITNLSETSNEPTPAPHMVLIRPALGGEQSIMIQVLIQGDSSGRIDSRQEIRDN